MLAFASTTKRVLYWNCRHWIVFKINQLKQVLIGFSDLKEMCVGNSGFCGLHFAWCVNGQLPFGEDENGEVCHPAAGVHSAVQKRKPTNKQAVNLIVYQDDGCPSTWIPEIPDTEAGIAESSVSCHHKQPEADSVVQVHKLLSDIEILADCTPDKEGGDRSEWTSIVNSADENTANFCKGQGWWLPGSKRTQEA